MAISILFWSLVSISIAVLIIGLISSFTLKNKKDAGGES